MRDMIPREELLQKEPRMLPSGTVFVRNRCRLCHCYWDTGYPRALDEVEHHDRTCPPGKKK